MVEALRWSFVATTIFFVVFWLSGAPDPPIWAGALLGGLIGLALGSWKLWRDS